MEHRVDSFSGLLAFIRAAETRNFVAAARQLGVSPSAIGKSIKRLEAKLGVRLLQRSTRQLSLTDEGAMYLERCRTILQELKDVEDELTGASTMPRGRLRISMPALGYRLLVPHLPEFHRNYPDISLDIDFADELVDVIEERFDAVVRSGNLANSGLTGRKLGPFSFVVCASPQYFARHGVPQTPADLATHACLHFRYRTSGKLQQWVLGPDGDGERLELPMAFVTNNAEAIRAAAIEGLGVAYTPRFVVQDALRDGRLQLALESVPKAQGTFWILWPSKRQMPARLRVLIEHLAARFDATA
jgi:DNA-binding transcriptional LysR family regulator